jgi:hypothetical protein
MSIFQGHAGIISLLSLSENGDISIIDMEQKIVKKYNSDPMTGVVYVIYNNNGKKIIFGDSNGFIYILKTENGAIKKRLSQFGCLLSSIAINNDNTLLIL